MGHQTDIPRPPTPPNYFHGWRDEALVEATLLKLRVRQSVCLVHFIRRFMAALGGLFATQSLFNQSAPPALTFITSPCHSLQGHAKYHQIFMILITAFRKESGGKEAGNINKSALRGTRLGSRRCLINGRRGNKRASPDGTGARRYKTSEGGF